MTQIILWMQSCDQILVTLALNLFNNLLDTTLTDKTLESKCQKDENDETLMSSNEDDDDNDETMNQNKKKRNNKTIK